MNEKIIAWAKKKPRTIWEIMDHFKIHPSKRQTLRRRLSENNITLKEARGRRKEEF
jgi:hypothetical protein